MSGSPTAAKTRPELVERIGDLARETGSTADELEAAAREYAEYERWKEAKVQEALDELNAGVPGVPNEEVMRWLESWGTDHELPPRPNRPPSPEACGRRRSQTYRGRSGRRNPACSTPT